MDSDSWTTRLSAASRRFQSRSDLYLGGDGIDRDDETRPEFLCPFCAEDFDVVGLCCHIDEEHAVEAKNGVCPVCAKRIGVDLVGHITMQHGSLLKVQRKRRYRKSGSNLTFSLLRKELQEENLQSLLRGSQYLVSSSNTEPDPLLSTFMYNLPVVDEPVRIKPHSSVEASALKESSVEDSSERNIPQTPLSDKDREERTRKCEFVQGLLLSTFLDENS
ncbi:RING-type E3 ubiquitin transferase [Sarracenia purpurea var. burkii]